MNDLPADPVPRTPPTALDGNAKALLIVVAALALLLVAYLLVDFAHGRLTASRLERRKRRARDSWQNEAGR